LLRILWRANRNQLLAVDAEVNFVARLAKGSDRIEYRRGQGRLAYPASAVRTWKRGSTSTSATGTPLRAWSVDTKRSGSGRGSCMLAMRSSNFGPPSLLAY